jgi:hypothetical protein
MFLTKQGLYGIINNMSEEIVKQENVVQFPPIAEPVELCSYNICAKSHKWCPTLGLAQCGGCKGPVVAVKMENCPICNEPPEEIHIRTDHIANGLPVVKFCLKEPSPGEVQEIVLKREHAVMVEKAPIGTIPLSVKNGVET